jgi:O-acetyl-ADP-ribose deacetylase (regulator of RNase III)
VFGYPAEPAARIAISTVREVVPGLASLREVIFCCFSEPDLRIYTELLERS